MSKFTLTSTCISNLKTLTLNMTSGMRKGSKSLIRPLNAHIQRGKVTNVIRHIPPPAGLFPYHKWNDCGQCSGPWFNIKMTSYQYRKSHCGDKTVARSSYLHNGISYTGKTSSLYWIRALEAIERTRIRLQTDGQKVGETKIASTPITHPTTTPPPNETIINDHTVQCIPVITRSFSHKVQ